MRIRPATLADLDALAELDARVFGGHAYPRAFFRQAYDLWGRWLLVAGDDLEDSPARVAEPSAASAPDDGARVLGSLLGARSLAPDEAWILSLAVAEQARGRGVGARLLAAALDVFAADGVRSVQLTVAPDNASALALYERAGFVVEARVEHAFGPGEARLRMRLALD